MYTPINQLNGYDADVATRTRERWDKPENDKAKSLVFDLIRKGGGEDFLQWEFEEGVLKGFLEWQQDLRGIDLFKESIVFPTDDNFENIDFSYSQFYHSTFENGCFHTNFDFAKLYNCKFINCIFSFAYWYGCTIENTTFENCDFIEHHRFTNCDFINCTFTEYSISKVLFSDCRFDSNTRVDKPKQYMVTSEKKRNSRFEIKQLTDFYRSLYEGYHASNVPELSRKYKYLTHKSRTDHCSQNWLAYLRDKVFVEYLTGYGLKPVRPLVASVVTIIYFSFLQGLFNTKITSTSLCRQLWEMLSGGFWISITAFSKLGNIAEWPFPSNILFISEVFVGTILFSLFVTTLSNTWFTE